MPQLIAPFHRSLESEKLLGLPCIDHMPNEHKPDEKWTTMHVKLPYEMRSRIVPRLRRKLKRYGSTDGGEKEIWMHIAPPAEFLEKKSRNRGGGSLAELNSVGGAIAIHE